MGICEANIDQVLQFNDVNDAACCLTDKLTNILDSMAPIKSIQIRSNYVHGLSNETKQLQKERNLAQQRAALTDNPEDWRVFRSLRNQATASVRRDKHQWERHKFSHLENNSSDMWKSLKSLLSWNSGGPPSQLLYEGRLVSRPAGLASTMNQYFIDKITGLQEKIPVVDTDPLKYMKEAMAGRMSLFNFRSVSLVEVVKTTRLGCFGVTAMLS